MAAAAFPQFSAARLDVDGPHVWQFAAAQPREHGDACTAVPGTSPYVRAFDETSGQPLLADASILEELRKNGHVIVDLMDAYRAKLSSLQNGVNGSLMAKRDRLLRQLARVQARRDEVTYHRASVEREQRAALEERLEHARSRERLKLLLLGREQEELARDVEAIQRFVAEVASLSSTNDPVHFLTHCRALEEACARLCAKPFKEGAVDVSPSCTRDDDSGGGVDSGGAAASTEAPEEARVAAKELSELRARHAALKRLLAAKDQMVWSLVEERRELQASVRAVAEEANVQLEVSRREAVALHARLAQVLDGEDVPPPPPPPRRVAVPPPPATHRPRELEELLERATAKE